MRGGGARAVAHRAEAGAPRPLRGGMEPRRTGAAPSRRRTDANGRSGSAWRTIGKMGRFVAAWPAVLAGVLLLIAGLAAVAFGALQRAQGAWDRLLDGEVARLVEAQRLTASSALGARLTRDAILSPDPRTFRALGLNRAEVDDLLARASASATTQGEREVVESLRADQASVELVGDALVAARARGAPIDMIRGVLESRLNPLRVRIDEGLARHVRLHEEALAATRLTVAAKERRAFAVIGGAAAGAVALAALLGGVLGRSLSALRGSEARFRATFDQAAVGLAHVALDGHWLRLNRRYRELLGWREADLVARTFADLLHAADGAADAAQLARLLAGEMDGYSLEVRCLTRGGAVVWITTTCAVVRDAHGRPAYLVRVAEDISARKRVERELREAVRARDEFVKVASHELRTPLATLRLQVESLRSALARGTPDPVRALARADAALRQAGRLDALVDGILDAAVLSGEDIELHPAEVDVAALVHGVLERAAPAAARDRTRLHLAADARILARLDGPRVAHALSHLLSNAIRYGAGHPVDVRVEADDERVRIAVEDHGVGIDPADVDRIFGRFERASSWRHYGGLGLGLFLTRRIAEAHGGSVRVDGAVGEGTTFTLELPRGGPDGNADASSRRSEPAPGQPHA
jgi:PAS domain S-box-containing protein